ncbi:MAG TPA: MFS transporter [Chthoniobacter sp.]|jgi:MFS family permease
MVLIPKDEGSTGLIDKQSCSCDLMTRHLPLQSKSLTPTETAAQSTGGAAVSSPSAWGNVVLAAMLILATLPGRTQGLGLITESLLRDFDLDRVAYADMNFWATLIGAAFCLPAGWLIDRRGLRWTTMGILALLMVTVGLMSTLARGFTVLFVLVVLSRGLGQSALTVASITAVGKSFAARAGWPMAVYAMLFNLFLGAGYVGVGWLVLRWNWRTAWMVVGLGLFVVLVLIGLCLREPARRMEATGPAPAGKTLGEALRTPIFWVFSGGTGLFLLVFSGLGLFNQAILSERGFDPETYHHFLGVASVCALPGQLLCGWLSLRRPLTRLLAAALFLYSIGLAALPLLHTHLQLWLFAATFGIAAGFINVIYFAVWGQAFGHAHLGRIQGAAQMAAVLATAVGPLIFAKCQAAVGSFTPVLVTLAAISFCAGLVTWQTKMIPADSSPPSPS